MKKLDITLRVLVLVGTLLNVSCNEVANDSEGVIDFKEKIPSATIEATIKDSDFVENTDEKKPLVKEVCSESVSKFILALKSGKIIRFSLTNNESELKVNDTSYIYGNSSFEKRDFQSKFKKAKDWAKKNIQHKMEFQKIIGTLKGHTLITGYSTDESGVTIHKETAKNQVKILFIGDSLGGAKVLLMKPGANSIDMSNPRISIWSRAEFVISGAQNISDFYDVITSRVVEVDDVFN